MRPRTVPRPTLAILLCGCLCACATYKALPLPAGSNLASSAARLSVDVSRLRLGPLEAHRFDPAHGLDPTDIAILTVLNSPDLQAKRALAKVATAQAFSAGLLPDPQVVASADFPEHPAGLVTAYGITPTIDLLGLVTHSTALKAARASARQADLDLLWSEWSAAQQARQLAVMAMADEAKAGLLRTIAQGLGARYLKTRRALATHDVTTLTNSADLAAKLDADAQLATAVQGAAKARGDLNALIGLASGARLNLVAGAPALAPSAARMDAALAALPERRPDLLALQAGYGAQDANLRKAILSQFPLINLGYSRQRDTGAILTNGLTATLVVPIFNRGRGDIAIQSATRARLRAEYQARLDQTVADVAAARRDRDADAAILIGLEARVPELLAQVDEARIAADRGDIDSAAFLALEQSALRQRVALLDLRLALALADISLESVLFLPSDQGATP
ncbi:MAG: TolC family protein [Pseudomonadota bacterium]|nr:TolC family protein [Pseudomonadota bacterium]